MYSLIRYAIGFAFFGLSLFIIKKCKITLKKAHLIVLAVVSLSVVVLLAFIPFENHFITFESPKAAYDYYNFVNADVALLAEGENCDFIVVRKRESYYLYSIVPKTADGWKIGIGSDIKKIFNAYNDDGILITVYQYKNTSDFFVKVDDIHGAELDVSDDYGNKFYLLKEENRALKKDYCFYFASVPEFSSGYRLNINGKTIILSYDP